MCGGGSAVPGLAPRLVRELHSRLLGATAPKLLQLPEYMPPHTLACASWMGGAVLAKVGSSFGSWTAPADRGHLNMPDEMITRNVLLRVASERGDWKALQTVSVSFCTA